MYHIAVIMVISLTGSQTLYPGAYVAEHAGVCKPAAQCTSDGDEGGNEKDRMELTIPGRGKYYIYTDTRCKLPLYPMYLITLVIRQLVTLNISTTLTTRISTGCRKKTLAPIESS